MERVQPQKGVPLQSPLRSPRRPGKWPFETMEVGDFFFSPRTRNTLCAMASTRGAALGRKFKTCMIWARPLSGGLWLPCAPETFGAVRGVGVWRVE